MRYKKLFPILIADLLIAGSFAMPVFANTVTDDVAIENEYDEISVERSYSMETGDVQIITDEETGRTIELYSSPILTDDSEKPGSIYENIPDDEIPNVFAAEFPSSYKINANENGESILSYLPPLKDQNPTGTCWAFATVGAAEINMAKKGLVDKDTVNYSEMELAYFAFHAKNDPLGGFEGDNNYGVYTEEKPNCYKIGGVNALIESALLGWKGLSDESVHKTSIRKLADEDGVDFKTLTNDNPNNIIKDEYAFDSAVRLKNLYYVNVVDNVDEVKQLVYNYGCVSLGYMHDKQYITEGNDKTAENNASYYCPSEEATVNHRCLIVGWDDNYSKDNFKGDSKPLGDGAWLVRNSWDETSEIKYGSSDYFWISYESKGLDPIGSCYDFVFVEDSYDNNYQYDGAGVNSYYKKMAKGTKVANVFTAKANDGGDEALTAVGFRSCVPNQKIRVDIYMNVAGDEDPENGDKVTACTTETTLSYEGFHTIQLSNPVAIESGSKFSVVITLLNEDKNGFVAERTLLSDTSPIKYVAKSRIGESFYKNGSMDINPWKNPNTERQDEGNIRIKAYTNNVNLGYHYEVNSIDIGQDEFTVDIGSRVGIGYVIKPVRTPDKSVTITSSDINIATVVDGYVTGIAKGDATITVMSNADNSVYDTCTVHVSDRLQKITVKPETEKTYRYFDENEQFNAEVFPYNEEYANSIIWSSSDPDIVSVDNKGYATVKDAGRVTIKAKVGEIEGTYNLKIYPITRNFIQKSCNKEATSTILKWRYDSRITKYTVSRSKYLDETTLSAEEEVYSLTTAGSGLNNGDIVTFEDNVPDSMVGTKYHYKLVSQKGLDSSALRTSRACDVTFEKGLSIIYELNGGKAADDTLFLVFPSNVSVELKTPSKEGYDFAGWYYDAKLTDKVNMHISGHPDRPCLTYNKVMEKAGGDITLYAKWTEHKNTPGSSDDEKNPSDNGDKKDDGSSDDKKDDGNSDEKKDDDASDDKKEDGTSDDKKDDGNSDDKKDDAIIDKNDPAKYDISKDIVIPKEVAENKTDRFVFHGLKDEYQYTGDAILPAFDLWVKTDTGRKLLVNGVDYITKTVNNKNAGTGYISIVGKGDYAGTVNQTAEFKIKDKSLEQPKGNISLKSLYKIDGISKTGYLYGGYEIKPKLRVIAKKENSDTKQILEEGKDYVVSWSNNVSAGRATVLVSGIGDYCGSIKLKFKIFKQNMSEQSSDYTVTLSDDVKKNGISMNNAKGAIPKVSVVFNRTNTKLILGKDYTIKCTNNKTVTNDASFTIIGRGNYTGKLDSKTGYFSGDRSFKVVKADISEKANGTPEDFIFVVPNLARGTKVLSTKFEVYDMYGNKLKTKIVGSEAEAYSLRNGVAAVVTYDGKTLNPAVKEDKNIMAEQGKKVTFTLYGTGNYTGSRKVDVKVVSGAASDKEISKVIVNKSYTYSSTGKPVTLDDNSIIVATKTGGQIARESYDVVYANNIDKGTAVAIFAGKGEYAGYKVVKFKIGPFRF